MSWLVPIAIVAGLCLLAVAVAALVPSPGTSVWQRIAYSFGRAYVRLLHRYRKEGVENVPGDGPAILVVNHTAGVDPVLVSAACDRKVRWIMAQDMRIGALEWFWRWQEVIFVGRDGKEPSESKSNADTSANGVREALKHLKDGGVLGIFPEGGIERPSRQILPFRAGVGLLIKRGKAPVIPVWIDGTPQVDPAWASLWRPSRSRVRFGETIDYRKQKLGAAEIAEDLRARFLEWTGWPRNDEPQDSMEQAPDAVPSPANVGESTGEAGTTAA